MLGFYIFDKLSTNSNSDSTRTSSETQSRPVQIFNYPAANSVDKPTVKSADKSTIKSAYDSAGLIDLTSFIELFSKDPKIWRKPWDTGAHPGTPITWITEGTESAPDDLSYPFGGSARRGAVILSAKGVPLYSALRKEIKAGIWDVWLIGPNAGIFLVKLESVFSSKQLPFNLYQALQDSGLKITLYKGVEVKLTTVNFIIYTIETPNGKRIWLVNDWSAGASGWGSQSLWLVYSQADADTLWDKYGKWGKQHVQYEMERTSGTRPVRTKLQSGKKPMPVDAPSR